MTCLVFFSCVCVRVCMDHVGNTYDWKTTASWWVGASYRSQLYVVEEEHFVCPVEQQEV